ncbi:hypothetical protein P0D72_38190 [Paraburkholderia sediminicola]|uniref:hypothetical protein n=1 Tax=Paraburkholderia sediminicola TaxID=458836 RepID=UPI000BC6DCF4|nr:hypothetical protein SAMN05446635_5648 [Burkholderia sp. OK233]
MKTPQLVAALPAAVTVVTATPSFAGGYGPAPFYRASVGSPASQRGQNTETVIAECQNGVSAQQAYGGMTTGSSESGRRAVAAVQDDLFAPH